MHAKSVLFAIIASLSWYVANTGRADVPAPPVNQMIGMPDTLFGELTEADCRACHDSSIQDRHHLLYGRPTPPGSLAPNPDADGNGIPDTTYACLSCHDASFTPVRDCIVCHTSNAHHRTPAAIGNDCVSCHGDVVDNIHDGHYIPTYAPSQATPSSRRGDGLPLNSRREGAGACDYCHDDDGLAVPLIRNTAELHHATSYAVDGSLDCLLCHDMYNPLSIRVCEGCHGPDSLHNIQADSPQASSLGTIVVGGEDAGYGHVGRDFGPGDSDCWGCHGFSMASAPRSGPIIPTVYSSNVASMRAGSNATITLKGASFTNTLGTTLYESDVALTAADGSAVVLTPDIILDAGTLVVTIPGHAAPGNYNLQAVKGEFASNPAVISILPTVTITSALANGSVTITGSGFGGYGQGSGTTVTGNVLSGRVRGTRKKTVQGTIISWSETKIVARFRETPQTVTVHSVFGHASCRLGAR
ncbi:MAG: hypothetical protein ACYC6N_21135 [Pirellulaceae bacterium]